MVDNIEVSLDFFVCRRLCENKKGKFEPTPKSVKFNDFTSV